MLYLHKQKIKKVRMDYLSDINIPEGVDIIDMVPILCKVSRIVWEKTKNRYVKDRSALIYTALDKCVSKSGIKVPDPLWAIILDFVERYLTYVNQVNKKHKRKEQVYG